MGDETVGVHAPLARRFNQLNRWRAGVFQKAESITRRAFSDCCRLTAEIFFVEFDRFVDVLTVNRHMFQLIVHRFTSGNYFISSYLKPSFSKPQGAARTIGA